MIPFACVQVNPVGGPAPGSVDALSQRYAENLDLAVNQSLEALLAMVTGTGQITACGRGIAGQCASKAGGRRGDQCRDTR